MDIFIARQPICDRARSLRGYQVLFWPGLSELWEYAVQEEMALSSFVSQTLVPEMRKILDGKKAFITFDHQMMESGAPARFRSTMVTVNIDEDVRATEAAIRTCRTLKERGFDVAVSLSSHAEPPSPLAELANIFRVDFAESSQEQIEAYPRVAEAASARLWATNVKTDKDFANAVARGYSLFQGEFLHLPGADVDSRTLSHGFACLRLLYEVNTPEPSMPRIAQIVAASRTLSEHILRIVNSPAVGLAREVSSVGLALPLLGLDEITKWISLHAASVFSDRNASVLLRSGLVRAKFTELLGQEANFKNPPSELFMLGLGSGVAPLFRGHMKDVPDMIPLSEQARSALTGAPGPHLNLLDLAVSYEQGMWIKVSSLSKSLGLDKRSIPSLYAEAIRWANSIL